MPVDPFTQPHWYAIQTRSRCEKRVRDQLTAKAILPFLPLWWKRSRWADRVKLIELPLFRGYLFGYFTFQQTFEVLATVGVTRLVRITHGPLAGVEGILVTKKSAARLIVRIELIQRAVAVDIDRSAVESLGW